MQLGNHYSELVKKVPDVLTGLVEKGRQRPLCIVLNYVEYIHRCMLQSAI